MSPTIDVQALILCQKLLSNMAGRMTGWHLCGRVDLPKIVLNNATFVGLAKGMAFPSALGLS